LLAHWLFSLSISGQTHEFAIYCNKQIDVRFSCIWSVIDNEFRHNIVKVDPQLL